MRQAQGAFAARARETDSAGRRSENRFTAPYLRPTIIAESPGIIIAARPFEPKIGAATI